MDQSKFFHLFTKLNFFFFLCLNSTDVSGLEWINVSEPIILSQHCLNKVVVLDFWTYCCINCYHVLPDLAHLEKLYTVENGLVVVSNYFTKIFSINKVFLWHLLLDYTCSKFEASYWYQVDTGGHRP